MIDILSYSQLKTDMNERYNFEIFQKKKNTCVRTN